MKAKKKFNYKNLIDYVGTHPYKVSMDASTFCQLNCPLCPNGKYRLKDTVIGRGYLKFENFKKFLDQNPNIRIIELANYGEVFLNPDLRKILEYSNKKDVRLTIFGGANLNELDEKTAEAIIKYKLRGLSVSIDGATNKTYKIYRKGGNFNRVIKNIKLINKYKKIYHSEFPLLFWQFVIMGHNEHEIPLAKKMAHKLNMTFSPKLNWDSSFSPIKNLDFVKKQVGIENISAEDFEKENKLPYLLTCFQVWESPQINWNGELLGCCVNLKKNFGNVFEEGLEKCLNKEEYKKVKDFLLGKTNMNVLCSTCSAYKTILENPLKKRDLVQYIINAMKTNLSNSEIKKILDNFSFAFYQNIRIRIDTQKILGKIGIVVKRISPRLYFKLKKIKEQTEK